jgi:predicted metal-dependent hydrolase
MTDAEFLRALERCVLPESDFGHRAHVRAAYLYLQAAGFAAALARMRCAIRNYARHLGNAHRYHETMTVAYLALIQQHICERGDGGSWENFALENPELLQPGLLLQYYARAQLDSELARRVFLLPSRRLPLTTNC